MENYKVNDVVTLKDPIKGIKATTFKIRAYSEGRYYLKPMSDVRTKMLARELLKHPVTADAFVVEDYEWRTQKTDEGLEFQAKNVNGDWVGVFLVADGEFYRRRNLNEHGFKNLKLDAQGRVRLAHFYGE